MGFLVELIKGTGKIVSKGLRYCPKEAKPRALLEFSHVSRPTASTLKGVQELRIKPDITMPVRPETIDAANPAIVISQETLAASKSAQGELGNVSVRLADEYKTALEKTAKKQIGEVFDGYDVSIRSKGANSIYSKLESKIKKGKAVIQTDADARACIGDAVGGRVMMNDLTEKEVLNAISELKIDGKALSKTEQDVLKKYVRNIKMSKSEEAIFAKLKDPFRTLLAEKQSQPVLDRIMLAGLKDALNRGVTSIEKIEKAGFSKEIVEQLKTNPNIKGMRITELNNYRGNAGIAYFSDRQVNEFLKLQKATGEKFDIISCSQKYEKVTEELAAKYGLNPNELDAIKASGYTTAQYNAVLEDGTLAEIQIRGKGPFAEYEHIAYDAKKGKNTLSSTYKEYIDAVKDLSEPEYAEYNRYITRCYNYYRKLELGIKSTKPKLPVKFNKILSEENMRRLHDLDVKIQNEKMKNFTPHIETSQKLSLAA